MNGHETSKRETTYNMPCKHSKPENSTSGTCIVSFLANRNVPLVLQTKKKEKMIIQTG